MGWCSTQLLLKEVAKLRGLGVAVDAQLFVSNRAAGHSALSPDD